MSKEARQSFRDKVCVVTGAGSGIGRAVAINLAARGASLAISDINPASLAETVGMIGGSNRVRVDPLDVADPAAIEPYAAKVRESFGPADFVFNIAGLARIGRFKDTPLASFEKVMNVNYWGVVRMTKAFLPQLIETRGCVVNISSLFGMVGVPGNTHYCSSKFAVRGFNEALAAEMDEHGVGVVSVHPGGVATNIARAAELDALPPDAASREEVNARFEKLARTPPQRAAEIIVEGAARRRRRVMVGPDARIISFVQRLFPASYNRILAPLFSRL